MEGMGVKFTPGIGRRLLTPFKHVLGLWLALLGRIASQNSPNEGLTLLQLLTLPYHSPHPLLFSHSYHPSTPLYDATFHITVVVK